MDRQGRGGIHVTSEIYLLNACKVHLLIQPSFMEMKNAPFGAFYL